MSSLSWRNNGISFGSTEWPFAFWSRLQVSDTILCTSVDISYNYPVAFFEGLGNASTHDIARDCKSEKHLEGYGMKQDKTTLDRN